jgi:hypothetical protein
MDDHGVDWPGGARRSPVRAGDPFYARWTGRVWATQAVDTLGSTGRYAALAIDANDRALTSYHRSTTRDLMPATEIDATTVEVHRRLRRPR